MEESGSIGCKTLTGYEEIMRGGRDKENLEKIYIPSRRVGEMSGWPEERTRETD